MFYYLCRIINVTASLLYPTYASYKALKSTSATASTTTTSTDPLQLERWTRYWCIMGIVWIYQDWFEWAFAWFPLYYELKTFFILFLVLPQIQGSTYFYTRHLSPFLSNHEPTIDGFVSNLSTRLRSASLSYLHHLVSNLKRSLLGVDRSEQQTVIMRSGTAPRVEAGAGGGPALLGSLSEYGLTQLLTTGANNLLRSLATPGLLEPPPTNQQVNVRSEGEGGSNENRLRRKRSKLNDYTSSSSSSSSSSSNETSDVEDDEEGRDASLVSLASSSSAGHGRGGGSRTSARSSNQSSTPTLRKPRTTTGENKSRSKRYVASRLGPGGIGEIGTSCYEDLGTVQAEEEYRFKDYSAEKGSGSRKGEGGGGWFGWGASEGTSAKKGKKD